MYLICEALSTSSWHQDKNIISTHCCVNHLSLVGTKGMIPKHFLVISLRASFPHIITTKFSHTQNPNSNNATS